VRSLIRLRVPEISTLVLFVLSSLFAIFLATILIQQNAGFSNTTPTTGISTVLVYMVFAIAVTFFILYLAKKKKMRIMRAIFLFLIIYVVFYVFLIVGTVIANTYLQYYIIIIAAPLIYAYFLIFRNNWFVTNLAGFFLSAGVSAIWGVIVGIWAAVIFLIAFAVYDYISVYKTKHMVSLAEVAINESLPLLFVMPTKRGVKLEDVRIDQEGERRALMLGFGDVALPSIMVVSSAMFGRDHMIWFILLPLLGGIIGMILLFSDLVKKPAPGLPFINSGVILGFLAAYLMFNVF